LKANPDTNGLVTMFQRDVTRMAGFKDIDDQTIRSIQAPALVLNTDQDVVLPKHVLALARTLPHARSAILPGLRGEYLGEICCRNESSKVPILVTALIEKFLGG
jgi:hypothetical protein